MSEKILLEFWEQAKQLIEEKKKRGGIPEYPTGLTFLDEITGGFEKGEIWIIAGKTGSGKTSLSLQLARNFAENTDHTILFLTLEMKGWQLILKMFCELLHENYTETRQGRTEIPPEKEEFFKKFISSIDFEIVEYGYTFEEVLKIFSKLYKNKRPDVIFLDFMQMVEWKQFGEERIAIMEYIRKLKELANKYNIGFVIVSQIRRLPSGADYNRPPDIIDLKGSGSLEQMADKVILIYKTIEKLGNDNIERHYINLAKNRQGEVVTKEVKFVGAESRWEDLKMVVYNDEEEK